MTKPTDQELDALRQADNGELNFVTLRQFRIIARAALAKWGTPPAVAGEPVAWQYRAAHEGLWFDCGEDRAKQRAAHPDKWEVRPLITAPQPTQAQAGAVPLTDEGILEMADSADRYANAMADCGALESYKQTWSAARDIELARRVESAHGIKGGQHE